MTSSWPRLIGIASGTFGAAVTTAQFIVGGSFRTRTLPEFIGLISGCVFLVLAFPLYTGREWARRALLLTTYCILPALAIVISPSVFHRSRSLFVLMGVCSLISFLTPPAFLLAVLHHADVRRAFQAKDASNQAMQPTASPCTASLSDD